MKVFLSWSGKRSQLLAEALRDWLPLVINAVEPWISSVDIAAGSRWNNEVAQQLEESRVGIFCLTAENLQSPWLHFEAGAIAKSTTKSFACTLLLGITPDQVEWPLAQFQAKQANEAQIQELVQGINSSAGPVLLREDHLLRAFNKWWPELAEKIKAIPPSSVDEEKNGVTRSSESLLSEILGLLRTQERSAEQVKATPKQQFTWAGSNVSREYLDRVVDPIFEITKQAGLENTRVKSSKSGVTIQAETKDGSKIELTAPFSITADSEVFTDWLKLRLGLAKSQFGETK